MISSGSVTTAPATMTPTLRPSAPPVLAATMIASRTTV